MRKNHRSGLSSLRQRPAQERRCCANQTSHSLAMPVCDDAIHKCEAFVTLFSSMLPALHPARA